MPQALAALRLDAMACLNSLFAGSPDCMKLLDLEAHLLSINQAGVELLGLDGDADLLGRSWIDYLPPGARQSAMDLFQSAKAGHAAKRALPLTTAKGVRHCEVSAFGLRDVDEAIVAVLIVTRDVTPLVDARDQAQSREHDLRRQTAGLRAAGHLAGLGGWELDLETGLTICSDEARTLLDAPAQIAFDALLNRVIHPRDVARLRRRAARCRRPGASFKDEVRLAGSGAEERWVCVFGEVDAQARFLRGAVQDVTARRRGAAELIAARDAAEQASRAKSVFLANMSHEIRTPLHGILGMTQVMERAALPQAQRKRLAIIRQSGDVLMAVLNDILDLSRIEAGQMPVNPRAFDLVQMLLSATSPFAALAQEKGLQLSSDVDKEARGSWRGDDIRLHQIVSNLVSNAVKFTPAGRITVTARATPDGLVVAVADDGPGLDEAQLGQLFQPFHQADNGVDRHHGGVGLGLSICRRLARLMDGDIAVDTAPGQGACFTVTLPFEKLATAQSPRPDQTDQVAPVAELRILAAEDNPTNRLILSSLLEPLQAALTLVEDGANAVEAFIAGDYDIVLMDIQMPVRNGLDATRDIRRFERERGKSPTPILALSANVMPHQIAEYRSAGIDEVLEKPVDVTALFRAMSALLAPA